MGAAVKRGTLCDLLLTVYKWMLVYVYLSLQSITLLWKVAGFSKCLTKHREIYLLTVHGDENLPNFVSVGSRIFVSKISEQETLRRIHTRIWNVCVLVTQTVADLHVRTVLHSNWRWLHLCMYFDRSGSSAPVVGPSVLATSGHPWSFVADRKPDDHDLAVIQISLRFNWLGGGLFMSC
jgi:hypothetical protein